MVTIGFNIFGDKILFGLTGEIQGLPYYFWFWGLKMEVGDWGALGLRHRGPVSQTMVLFLSPVLRDKLNGPFLQPGKKASFKMLEVEILRGVIVDGDDVETDGPVVVDEFLVLGPYTSIEA